MGFKYDGKTLRGGLGGFRIQTTPEEANEIVKAIMKYNRDMQRIKEENLRATGQIWIAHYRAWGHDGTEECFSLQEALDFLIDGANAEQHSISKSGKIVCPDGKVIQGEEFWTLIDSTERARG